MKTINEISSTPRAWLAVFHTWIAQMLLHSRSFQAARVVQLQRLQMCDALKRQKLRAVVQDRGSRTLLLDGSGSGWRLRHAFDTAFGARADEAGLSIYKAAADFCVSSTWLVRCNNSHCDCLKLQSGCMSTVSIYSRQLLATISIDLLSPRTPMHHSSLQPTLRNTVDFDDNSSHHHITDIHWQFVQCCTPRFLKPKKGLCIRWRSARLDATTYPGRFPPSFGLGATVWGEDGFPSKGGSRR